MSLKKVVGKPNNGKKRSLTAKQVAKDVQATILKGEPVVLKQIVARRGYAKSTQINPQRVTNTESYKEEMFNFVAWLDKEIERITKAISAKDLNVEEFKVLADALDKLNKNKLLATGGNTENIGVSLEISETIANKNGLSALTPHK